MSAESKTLMNLAEDLMIMSPMRQPCSILKPSQKDNLILLQTPVHKNLKVSFITPQSTPVPSASKAASFQLPSQPFHGSMSSVSSLDDLNFSSNLPKSPNVLDQSTSSEKNWDVLRQLDENLKWKDRVEIITKLDHKDYTIYATEFVVDMIFSAVDISESRTISDDDKISQGSDQACQSSVSMSENIERDQNISTTVNDDLVSLLDNFKCLDLTANSNLSVSTPANIPVSTIVPVQPGNGHSDLTKPHNIKSSISGKHDSKPRSHPPKRLYSTELQNIPEDFDPFDDPQNPADQNKKNLFCHQFVDSGIESITASMAGLQMQKNQAFTTRQNTSSRISNNSDPKTPNLFSHSDLSFSSISPTPNLNLENEVFVDGAQLLQQGHFDLDYLEQKTSGDVSHTLRKQSLYMKFDPLLENISPRKSLAMIGRKSDIIDFNERATPLPNDLEDLNTPSPREPDLLCDSPSQLSIITCMSNSAFLPNESRNGSASSASSNVSNSGEMKSDFGIVEVLKYTDADVERILRKKKAKWMRDKETAAKDNVTLEKELERIMIILEGYEDFAHDRSKECSEENKSQDKKPPKEEYEADTMTVSKITSAIMQQYEQLQRVHANLTSNQVSLTEAVKKVKTKLDETNNNIVELEKKTEEEEGIVLAALKKCNSQTTFQHSALNSKIKSLEVKAKGLQATLTRKQNENAELVKICDELVTNAEERS